MVYVFEKTDWFAMGVTDVSYEHPLELGPCLIVIPSKTFSIHSLNVYFDTIAKLFDPNTKFKRNLNRRILGLGYGEYSKFMNISKSDTPTDDEIDEFINTRFSPLFMGNDGKRLDVLETMKRFRNLTFLTHCDGALIFIRIENALKAKMSEFGYSDEEIGLILSQVCLAEVAGDALAKKGNETSTLALVIGDVYDSLFENREYMFNYVKAHGPCLFKYRQDGPGTSLCYATACKGFHFFDDCVLNNSDLQVGLRAFLSASLGNALENQNSNSFNQITEEKMVATFNIPLEEMIYIPVEQINDSLAESIEPHTIRR